MSRLSFSMVGRGRGQGGRGQALDLGVWRDGAGVGGEWERSRNYQLLAACAALRNWRSSQSPVKPAGEAVEFRGRHTQFEDGTERVWGPFRPVFRAPTSLGEAVLSCIARGIDRGNNPRN